MAATDPTDPPRFRAATAADVPAVVELVQSAYRGQSSRAGWTTEADWLTSARVDEPFAAQLIASPTARVVLAERGGVLVACCELQRVAGDLAYFGMFAVDPRLQAGGIGSAVLAEAERIAAQEWGCSALEMTVIDIRNELIAWYERRGYRVTGETREFPADPLDPPKIELLLAVLRKALTPREPRGSGAG